MRRIRRIRRYSLAEGFEVLRFQRPMPGPVSLSLSLLPATQVVKLSAIAPAPCLSRHDDHELTQLNAFFSERCLLHSVSS